jgi:2-oxo-3-hexenedioate decarboxylase
MFGEARDDRGTSPSGHPKGEHRKRSTKVLPMNTSAAPHDATPLDRIAADLLAAHDAARCMPLPSHDPSGFTLPDAYEVGRRLHALRVARGEQPVGWKIGFTNRTIWPRYDVYAPIWGPVWDTTAELLEGDEATLSIQGLSQPRLEPEIVFGFARAPRAGMTLAELQACLAWVAHGFEVVHTHFDAWKFTAADCLADFALHGRLRVGPRVPVEGWHTMADDLAALRVVLHRDGHRVDEGVGANVLDGPLHALRTWIDAMAQHTPHWQVRAGEFVTTGTITDAWPLEPGQRWQTGLQQARGESRLSDLTLWTAGPAPGAGTS